jgi:membrane-bound metal-dependent hydrolase YbcI (DUF457 family)
MAGERTRGLDVLLAVLVTLAVLVWLVGPLGFIVVPVALAAAGRMVSRRGHRDLKHVFYVAALVWLVVWVWYAAFIYVGSQSG